MATKAGLRNVSFYFGLCAGYTKQKAKMADSVDHMTTKVTTKETAAITIIVMIITITSLSPENK